MWGLKALPAQAAAHQAPPAVNEEGDGRYRDHGVVRALRARCVMRPLRYPPEPEGTTAGFPPAFGRRANRAKPVRKIGFGILDSGPPIGTISY